MKKLERISLHREGTLPKSLPKLSASILANYPAYTISGYRYQYHRISQLDAYVQAEHAECLRVVHHATLPREHRIIKLAVKDASTHLLIWLTKPWWCKIFFPLKLTLKLLNTIYCFCSRFIDAPFEVRLSSSLLQEKRISPYFYQLFNKPIQRVRVCATFLSSLWSILVMLIRKRSKEFR